MILNLTLPDEIEDIPAAEPQQDMLVKRGSDVGSSADEGADSKGQMNIEPGKEIV
jgi:hypothetical protein